MRGSLKNIKSHNTTRHCDWGRGPGSKERTFELPVERSGRAFQAACRRARSKAPRQARAATLTDPPARVAVVVRQRQASERSRRRRWAEPAQRGLGREGAASGAFVPGHGRV